ncbi:hypothetical protein N6H14_33670 [Paenibacillus sp. CC-CFT747]|nr:hypothetical protein N6H14_33670 [Paenibacillus sp. CC-CFT747]
MLKNLGIRLYGAAAKALTPVKNERGAQAIEYIGIAAVAVVLILALISAVGDKGGGIAGALVKKLEEFIGKLKIG